MKRFLATILICLLLPLQLAIAQGNTLKENFLEAESYFLFEEYSEALGLYQKIQRADPDNDNINYKVGVCLLNDPFQKDKSIRYLEQASKNINPKYKENNFNERTAPPEAFFYLGNAYLVNNQIDKALENYTHFREIMDERIYDAELVDEQIRICNTARQQMKMPVDFDAVTLPPYINTRFTDKNPVVSGDGNTLIYVSELQFYDATFYSVKVDGAWQPPRNIIPELGVDGDVYPTCLSFDGKEMIIYRNDDFVGNLYHSKYVEGRWSEMTKLGNNINTKYWESHGCLSRDGNFLYFTSNRKGGYGGLDIYQSEKQDDGTWGEPVNLGETINTRYNEETPFITTNGQFLFFSSYGHLNMGGYDIFYSRLNETGQWDIPINLGYPINTTDDDLFFHPVDNGNSGYFSIYTDEGQGRNDIYFLQIYSADNPRMYLVTGFFDPGNNGLTKEDDVHIYLVDRISGDTLDMATPDLAVSSFTVKAPKGIYDLVVKSNTFNEISTPLEINEASNKKGIQLASELVLEKISVGPKLLTGDDSKIKLADSLYTAKEGEPVQIKLKLEKNATLFADVFADSIQTSSDTINIDRRRFTYEMIPAAGVNRIELTLIDEDGNISKKTIEVMAEVARVKVVPALKEKAAMERVTDTVKFITATDSTDSDNERSPQDPDHPLLLQSEGALKAYLQKLDLSQEGETPSVSLIEHLAELAGTEFPAEEFTLLLARFLGSESAESFSQYLQQSSSGKLKRFLRDLDLEAKGISTAENLIRYLLAHADETGITKEELVELLNSQSVQFYANIQNPGYKLKEPVKGNGKFLTTLGLVVLLLIGIFSWWFFVVWKRRKEDKEEI